MAFRDKETKSMIETYDKRDEALGVFLCQNGLLILNKYIINFYKSFIKFISYICIFRMVSKEKR